MKRMETILFFNSASGNTQPNKAGTPMSSSQDSFDLLADRSRR
jgi:hypothetical protein